MGGDKGVGDGVSRKQWNPELSLTAPSRMTERKESSFSRVARESTLPEGEEALNLSPYKLIN